MAKKTEETSIQNTICEYLELKKHFFSRINNIPVYDQKKKIYRKLPKYQLAGFPDIIVLWKQFPVFIEVKAKKGRLSPEQKKFQDRCEKQGIEYIIARSLKDVIEYGL